MNETIWTGSLTHIKFIPPHNVSNSLKLIVFNAPTSHTSGAHSTQSKNLMLDTLDLLQTMIERERDTEFDHKWNLNKKKIDNSYARSNTQTQIQPNKVYLASQKICICFEQIEKERRTQNAHTH